MAFAIVISRQVSVERGYMNNTQRNNGDIEYKVSAMLGVISSYSTGWNKELNIISWNGGPAKFDIRDWDKDHQRMSRGVTLHEEEAKILMGLLENRFNEQRGGRRVRGTWPSDNVSDEAPSEEPAVQAETDQEQEASAEEPIYEE